MKKFALSLQMTGLALLLGVANVAWAEAAPVYDVEAIEMGMGESINQASHDSHPSNYGLVPEHEGSDTPAYYRKEDDQRLSRVEKQIQNMQSSDSFTQVESLQRQVQDLRGQVEILTRKLNKAEASQRTMYSDLDKRIAEVKAASQGAVIAATDVSSQKAEQIANAKQKLDTHKRSSDKNDRINVAEEQRIYQTAYDHIKARKYGKAVESLQNMLKKYPDGQFASNAHYWLGELYGLMSKNDKALDQFKMVLKKFPDSPRVSDAQLKIGLIFAAQSKWSLAKNSFRKVIRKYPGTASSRLASEQLKQIKKAGH